MWTIVQLNELCWVMLWDGEIFGQIFWSLDECVQRLRMWYLGY